MTPELCTCRAGSGCILPSRGLGVAAGRGSPCTRGLGFLHLPCTGAVHLPGWGHVPPSRGPGAVEGQVPLEPCTCRAGPGRVPPPWGPGVAEAWAPPEPCTCRVSWGHVTPSWGPGMAVGLGAPRAVHLPGQLGRVPCSQGPSVAEGQSPPEPCTCPASWAASRPLGTRHGCGAASPLGTGAAAGTLAWPGLGSPGARAWGQDTVLQRPAAQPEAQGDNVLLPENRAEWAGGLRCVLTRQGAAGGQGGSGRWHCHPAPCPQRRLGT